MKIIPIYFNFFYCLNQISWVISEEMQSTSLLNHSPKRKDLRVHTLCTNHMQHWFLTYQLELPDPSKPSDPYEQSLLDCGSGIYSNAIPCLPLQMTAIFTNPHSRKKVTIDDIKEWHPAVLKKRKCKSTIKASLFVKQWITVLYNG